MMEYQSNTYATIIQGILGADNRRNSNGNRFTTIGGGLPILGKDRQVLGAVGCSTGTPAQDQEVAQAGVDAAQKLLKGEKAKL